jgi:hypothetical protein
MAKRSPAWGSRRVPARFLREHELALDNPADGRQKPFHISVAEAVESAHDSSPRTLRLFLACRF